MHKILNIIKYFVILLIIMFLIIVGIVIIPKKQPSDDYLLIVRPGQGISSVLKNLNNDNIIYNYYIALFAALVMNINRHVKTGYIHLDSNKASIYNILLRIKQGPNKIVIRIIEGKTFLEIKNYIDSLSTVAHDSLNLQLKDLEKLIDAKFHYKNMEGFLYPATYYFYEGVSDIDIYKRAYKLMLDNLEKYWQYRNKNLPYKDKYDILIMASLIEKETANIDDMSNIAAVFVNRINKNMLLQSDPTVIYALGKNYHGKLFKQDLFIDSLYNTYKYKGLPPTPIAMPSKMALEATISPAHVSYLFFVSKKDNTGKSVFSNNLKEHNDAVNKYILKNKR